MTVPYTVARGCGRFRMAGPYFGRPCCRVSAAHILVTLAMKIGVCRAIGALASAFAILAAPAHTNGSSPFVTEITRFLKGGWLLTNLFQIALEPCRRCTPLGPLSD